MFPTFPSLYLCLYRISLPAVWLRLTVIILYLSFDTYGWHACTLSELTFCTDRNILSDQLKLASDGQIVSKRRSSSDAKRLLVVLAISPIVFQSVSKGLFSLSLYAYILVYTLPPPYNQEFLVNKKSRIYSIIMYIKYYRNTSFTITLYLAHILNN